MEKIKFRIPELQNGTQKAVKISERASILKEFLDTLNNDRKLPYKPLTPARVGMLLAPIKTKDLYSFLADCKYAPNFSKYFWWSVNPKKHK